MKTVMCAVAMAIALLSAQLSGADARIPFVLHDDPHYATDRDIEKWIHKWQKKLDLAAWKITGRVAKASEMSPDVLGQSAWTPSTKTAGILVLEGSAYDAYSLDIRYDQELTVVHELVHIRLAAVLPFADERTKESFVVAMSEAIYGHRAKK